MLEHLNIALVGCAHIHTPGFAHTLKSRADTTVSAVWDHHPERAAHYAAELGCQARELVAILLTPPLMRW